ncbi:SDR family NAD(P)-dependent oxidoreductase [Jeotgalibacillus marinus]|uniref:SDR family oxidoreductase n=1 Tax=Jeotgalibacillus marinus TaxID=86667 RepID=A0ABV3Q715_9BACL
MSDSQVVIVTGAANGIGLEVSKAYLICGDRVIMVDIKKEKLLEEVGILKKSGFDVYAKICDVGSLSDVKKMMTEIMDEAGKIDVLINNAGQSAFKSIWDVTEDDWLSIISSNLSSVFFCSREAAQYMNGGSIVNMCSTRATMSESDTEAYATSKGGIHALTHSLAVTLSERNITVNAISPGWIATENYDELREVDHQQHLSNRVGKPSDIARACLFLTDPLNTFITGENLVVDGGMTRKMIYEP